MWRSIGLIVKHDIGVILRQWSFWVLSFVMPAILLAYLSYDTLRDTGQTGTGSGSVETPTQALANLPAIGLVDEAGLINQMPPGLPTNWLKRFPDQAAARAALEAGEIEQYVHLSADYLATGQVTVYDQGFEMLARGGDMGVAYGSANAWVLEYLINYNLTSDVSLLALLRNPTPGSLAARHVVNPPPATEASMSPLVGWVSSLVPFIYYFLLVLSGSYLLRSVVAEKENRTAEVLLLSVPSRDLMIGKILAMSVVLLMQLVIWLGGAALIINRRPDLLPMAGLSFPPGFWLGAAVFLLLGYLLYASVMAAAGALAPNAREGGQIIWLLILPLMPTMMFSSEFVEQPDSLLTLFLSLFPFSAPSAMVTRLAVSQVPLWQLGVSLAGLALTTWLFVVWAGRFFRADHLLSFATFNWRRLLTDWRR